MLALWKNDESKSLKKKAVRKNHLHICDLDSYLVLTVNANYENKRNQVLEQQTMLD